MIKIKQHKTLNPKLWLPDNTLSPEVSRAILRLVANFLHNLRFRHNIIFEPHEIKDIFIYGSNADYFYTKKSDIDICVVVDLLRLRTQNPYMNIEKTLKLCYHEWEKYHEEKIYGHSIDISFDDIYFPKYNGRHRAGPQYSLIDKIWIYEHRKLTPQEFKQICKEASVIYAHFMRKYRYLKRHGLNYKQLKLIHREISDIKNQTYANDPNQLVSPVSITWRNLKYYGVIDKIRKIMVKKISEKLSLQ